MVRRKFGKHRKVSKYYETDLDVVKLLLRTKPLHTAQKMKFSNNFPADLVTFTVEILCGCNLISKLHSLELGNYLLYLKK